MKDSSSPFGVFWNVVIHRLIVHCLRKHPVEFRSNNGTIIQQPSFVVWIGDWVFLCEESWRGGGGMSGS
jgi:hypothetical protein